MDAPTFEEYLDEVEANRDLWRGLWDRASVPPAIPDAPEGGRWHLLAISEDWCGDAVNTLPVVARWVESQENVDLRVFGRDDNPDLMDAHLTNGTSRSIPIVIVYDENFDEIGWWGPRPTELQTWVLGEGRELDKDERYRHVRRWYARDRGATILTELIDILHRTETPRHAP